MIPRPVYLPRTPDHHHLDLFRCRYGLRRLRALFIYPRPKRHPSCSGVKSSSSTFQLWAMERKPDRPKACILTNPRESFRARPTLVTTPSHGLRSTRSDIHLRTPYLFSSRRKQTQTCSRHAGPVLPSDRSHMTPDDHLTRGGRCGPWPHPAQHSRARQHG